jgi:hypothetical protein
MHVSESGVCDYPTLKQYSPKILLLPFFEICSYFQHIINWAVVWRAVWWMDRFRNRTKDVDICDVEYEYTVGDVFGCSTYL